MNSDVRQIKEVWQRLFGINVEAVRQRRGLSSLAEQLQMLKKYQASSAHVDDMLKQLLSRSRRSVEFNEDQPGFWDAELNQRIKQIFDSETAAPPISAEAQQKGGTAK